MGLLQIIGFFCLLRAATPNSIAGTTTVVCSSNSDLLIATFAGVDLTRTSSSGQEYQRALIRDGILVGRCAESNGAITCVFYTSIAEGTFECCAGPCASITLCKFNIEF